MALTNRMIGQVARAGRTSYAVNGRQIQYMRAAVRWSHADAHAEGGSRSPKLTQSEHEIREVMRGVYHPAPPPLNTSKVTGEPRKNISGRKGVTLLYQPVDLDKRELLLCSALLAMAFVMGVYPNFILDMVNEPLAGIIFSPSIED